LWLLSSPALLTSLPNPSDPNPAPLPIRLLVKLSKTASLDPLKVSKPPPSNVFLDFLSGLLRWCHVGFDPRRLCHADRLPDPNKTHLALLTAGASTAAAILYLAHKGNVHANWFTICQQFDSFREHISGSLIRSFAAMVILISFVSLSAFALARHH
jgi:ABC-type glycerol-3-phosphate transport system permease component